jgi:hypothetical protein
VLRRLVEHGIACEQRRYHRIQAHEVGVVPRAHVRDHAERFVRHALFEVGTLRDGDRVEHVTDMIAEPGDAVARRADLVARLRDRLADLRRRRRGERVHLDCEHFAHAVEQCGPFRVRPRGPCWLRAARPFELRRDRAFVVDLDRAQYRAGRGVVHVERARDVRRRRL